MSFDCTFYHFCVDFVIISLPTDASLSHPPFFFFVLFLFFLGMGGWSEVHWPKKEARNCWTVPASKGRLTRDQRAAIDMVFSKAGQPRIRKG